ncbi:hypothetical protein [Comamonas sp. JC664]|uniref:hypothetical protein n=1 Tax=Comamonas sp. JC664 TaxID=2801917 RepID=UPI00191D4BF0|nr:hypothetical protein [Comamonas sp. JC664]MBL0696076.1 hypothetical protein [Comamonas sp. JC664]GHG65116.1 hypothetical protein GCM10012319_06060 [Comamonas sp. KCTC 72670]
MAGKGKKDTDSSGDERPRDIGDDQRAGFHAGENFQPRNRGQVEDALDRGAADVSRRLTREADATPNADTPWEARVERGEEWMTQEVPEREARGDEEPDSAVSRQGLVSPPPEE